MIKSKRSRKDKDDVVYIPERPVKLLRPLNQRQANYLESICRNDSITIAIGAAGTGKTFLASAKAIDFLQAGIVSSIILIRPLVSADEKIGHLPGEIENKVAPFMEPYIDCFNDRVGKAVVTKMLTDGRIQIKPLAFLQGKTFNDCVILVDEAENLTRKNKKDQMKLILTRMGQNCRAIFMGDPAQTYVDNSAFGYAIKVLKTVPRVRIIHFLTEDVVRSDACRDVLNAYDLYEGKD